MVLHFDMRKLLQRSVPLTFTILLALIMGAYAAISNNQDSGYTFCVNSKTKVVTYIKVGKCPKGSESLVVGARGATGEAGPVGPAGATGPQGAKGDTPQTSFNLVLRDGSGAMVKGLVADGAVIRNGYYWSLEYATGKFFPTGYLYEYYLTANCTGEYVYPISTPIENSARWQYESLLKSARSNVLFAINTFDGALADIGPYTFTNDVSLIDNRNFTAGTPAETWSTKTPVYFKNSYNGDVCENASQSWFYIKGITKSSVQIPAALPAPVKWSEN